MKYRNIIKIICLCTALVFGVGAAALMNPSSALTKAAKEKAAEGSKLAETYEVTDLTVKSEAMSVESVKVTWAKQKDVSKWKVRMAVVDEETDEPGEFRTLKENLNRKHTSFLKKNLKKNTTYRFRVIGYVSKGGKLRKEYVGETENYTGIAAPKWEEDAAAYDCSPKLIRVAVHSSGTYGLIEGYQIERRVKGTSDFEVVGEINDMDRNSSGAVIYKDKKVKAGETYEYQMRAFVGNNFSEYSEDMLTMSAVVTKGTFKTREIRRSVGELVVSMTGGKDNGDAVFEATDLFYPGGNEDKEAIKIKAWSTDGRDWQELKVRTGEEDNDNTEVTLKAEKTIYLKFVPCHPEKLNLLTIRDKDGKVPSEFISDGVMYNRQNAIFKLVRSGDSTASRELPESSKDKDKKKD